MAARPRSGGGFQGERGGSLLAAEGGKEEGNQTEPSGQRKDGRLCLRGRGRGGAVGRGRKAEPLFDGYSFGKKGTPLRKKKRGGGKHY